jgi:predicted MFS family arabinose efflux permease
VAERLGHMVSFLGVTCVGLTAVAVLSVLMPETNPSAPQRRPAVVGRSA